MPDFETFPKVDAHFHSTFENCEYGKIAHKYNLRFININTDAEIFPSLERQEKVARWYQRVYPEYFYYVCSFSMDDWTSPDWINGVKSDIENSMAHGARGVKIWKNIGMEIQKKDNSYLMVDDPLFTPLFEFLCLKNIPVLGHLGEPFNCWLPLDKMTTERNRTYYEKFPQYHAYLHPEIPSYQNQLDARDTVLRRFPKLVFIGAHLGSIEWNYGELSSRFDKFPNFAVDVSSRLSHLQLQSEQDYEGVRNFFICHADRIIYGTDAYNNMDKLKKALFNDWEYLATENLCFSYEGTTIRGLGLPEDVLFQIYYENARKYFRITE